MYQKNLGKQIWEILSPIIIYNVALMVVEMIFIGIQYVNNLDRIAVLSGTPEEVRTGVIEILSEVLEYSVEMMGIAAFCSIPIFLYMMKRDRLREGTEMLRVNQKAPVSKYILIAGLCIPFALGLNNLMIMLNIAAYSSAYQEAVEVFYGARLIVQIVTLGILTPIAEELIFRGLIYNRMKLVMKSPKGAIIFSGLLFGFYHGNLVQTIYGCLCGFLLAYLYEKYGSIKAPVLGHICMNMVSLILTEANVFVWMFENVVRMGIITVVCAALASSVFLFVQKIDEKPLKNEQN